MKIAIVEWWPRICGATNWGRHLGAGGENLGVDVDFITFSKSGRQLKGWGVAGSHWDVHRQADAVDVLDEYDAVVLTDVVARNPDWTKRSAVGLPYYVDVLARIRPPWTTMLHDGAYQTRLDPTIEAVLATRSFSGQLITTREREVRARFGSTLSGIQLTVDPCLPYNASWSRAGRRKRSRRAVLMTSRITSNKGQSVLLYHAAKLHGDVELGGYNAFGLPSGAWLLWELAQALGYESLAEPVLRRDCQSLTHPNAPRFYTGAWSVSTGKRKAGYIDGYDYLDEVDWSPRVHVSLSNETLRGTLEYSTLDAIAGGTVAVVPAHSVDYGRRESAWDSLITIPFQSGSAYVSKTGVKYKIDGDDAVLVNTLNRILDAPDSHRDQLSSAQQEELVTRHDPSRILEKVIGGLPKRPRAKKERPVTRTVAPRGTAEEIRRGAGVTQRDLGAARKALKSSSSKSKLPRSVTPDRPARKKRPIALGAYIFAGGFTYGVRKHFDVAGHFEDGDYGVATAAAAFPGLPISCRTNAWPWPDFVDKVGLLYGNPPCAAWSPLGPRAQRGIDAWKTDPRVDCARTLFNLMELVRPTVWAWESVPQAYTTGRPLVSWMTDRAVELGYSVDYVLHNARYLGAYQSRKRFFMVCSRVDIDWKCPWLVCPTGAEALDMFPGRDDDEGWKADDYYSLEFLEGVPPGKSLRGEYDAYLEKVMKREPNITEARRKKIAPRPSFGERRIPADRPSGAVVDSHNVHPTEVRYLSLGEMMWMGGYPLDMPLIGTTVEAKARQLTRAVLPPVGGWLAGNVRKAIDLDRPAPGGRVREINLYKPPGVVVTVRGEEAETRG